MSSTQSSNIYPILVSNEEMQELFNILNKYSDTILQMAKVVGGNASSDYDRAVQIINSILMRVEDAISPMQCLSKQCMDSNYCYKPSQCLFVEYMKKGYNVARVDDQMLDSYMSIGWKLIHTDETLRPTSKRHLVIYKKLQ